MNYLMRVFLIVASLAMLSACSRGYVTAEEATPDDTAPVYLIGPGDTLQIFIWGNPDLSATVPVRPDGRITVPLVEDVVVSGKTSTQLARELEVKLSRYVKNPIVSVVVTGFVGRYSEQVRVVGEASEPKMLPYRANMTLLDVMIEVGGLTEYAAGNRASIVRNMGGEKKQFRVYLDDLIKDGEISKNVKIYPGDVLIIPEAWF